VGSGAAAPGQTQEEYEDRAEEPAWRNEDGKTRMEDGDGKGCALLVCLSAPALALCLVLIGICWLGVADAIVATRVASRRSSAEAAMANNNRFFPIFEQYGEPSTPPAPRKTKPPPKRVRQETHSPPPVIMFFVSVEMGLDNG
jgi:hypothetical protein